MGQLSITGVKAAERPGRFGDGDGLFLVVRSSGSKSCGCRVQKHGRRRDIGLGSASKVTLSVACDRAREVRTWVEIGLDPVRARSPRSISISAVGPSPAMSALSNAAPGAPFSLNQAVP